jgi:hypothetical protein
MSGPGGGELSGRTTRSRDGVASRANGSAEAMTVPGLRTVPGTEGPPLESTVVASMTVSWP